VGRTTIPLGLNFGLPNLFGGPPNLENPEKGLLCGSLISPTGETSSFSLTALFDFAMELLYNIIITSFVRPPESSGEFAPR
jgi:hypothetical protein